jgi:ATP adenylyltransferase
MHHDSQWEIRLCEALQKKPVVPLPAGEAGIAPSDQSDSDKTSKNFDPFAPPYVPNLHVGDLRDESSGAEYGVLVRSLFSGNPSISSSASS